MLIATAQPTGASAQPSFLAQMIFPVAIFLIFYFLIIRPQSKRAKQHRAMIGALSVGNEVVFAGGLMGTIKAVEGEYARVALNATTEVKIQKAAVISVLPAGTLANI